MWLTDELVLRPIATRDKGYLYLILYVYGRPLFTLVALYGIENSAKQRNDKIVQNLHL